MTVAPVADTAERPTVLIVDDEAMVLRAFSRALAQSSCLVETCSTACQAIERAARGGVHVIVSDVSMPEMSGVELLRVIRKHDPDLPIVLVTGRPDIDSAASAVRYGAFKYLMKPVLPTVLQATVEQAAQLYRLAQVKRQTLELLGVPGGAVDRAGLETSFDRALATLWIAFQPIVSVSDRSVFGYEALLRTEDPALPGPSQMLDAAERLGVTARLGRAIRGRAAAAISSHSPDSALFVNLHPQDLLDPELSSAESPLAQIANRVVLELTERASLTTVADVAKRIAGLRELGYRIAIDDLGAGYAGLTSFALLEPEIVKLDMTLVRDIDSSPVRQKLVASMTALCKDMGMAIVAEGVETIAERDTLVMLGCDLLQGYLFARPGPPFPELVRW